MLQRIQKVTHSFKKRKKQFLEPEQVYHTEVT